MTGHAALDAQGSEAVITVDTSDKPYGLLTIAPTSLRVTTEEREQIIKIYINREFGASGKWFNYEFKKKEKHSNKLIPVYLLKFCIHFLQINLIFVCTGAVNITYEVIRGSVQNLSQVEGALAESGQDFISGTGYVILQEGQTSVAIPVTILEVKPVTASHNATFPFIKLDSTVL